MSQSTKNIPIHLYTNDNVKVITISVYLFRANKGL